MDKPECKRDQESHPCTMSRPEHAERSAPSSAGAVKPATLAKPLARREGGIIAAFKRALRRTWTWLLPEHCPTPLQRAIIALALAAWLLLLFMVSAEVHAALAKSLTMGPSVAPVAARHVQPETRP